jgi:2-desacetyl-2-hydroxyethyl bacteriochlorophyllide A dehydrogenase
MKNEMRSVLFTEVRQSEVRTFPVPECDNGKILVKIEACGICTFEQRVFSGVHKVEYPIITGHETAGYIAAIGKDVTSGEWHIGDKVIIGAILPCRDCYTCKSGEIQNCIHFSALQLLPGQPYHGLGGLSEYMMAVPQCIFKYYDVPAAEACLTEPLSCVLHSVETANLHFGHTVVIIGSGFMGLLHTLLCVLKGTCVIVVDMNEERLNLAKKLGAHHTINPEKENVEKAVLSITHGHKAEAVFDTTPIASVVEEACHYVGNVGKVIIYSGIYPDKPITLSPHWLHKNGIQIIGTANSNDQDFMRAVSMISNHVVDLSPFISGVYPVKDIESAMESSCTGKTFRNIITFD